MGTKQEVTSIALPSGHTTLVDTADLPLLDQYRWFVRRSRNGKLYVRGYRAGGPNEASLHMHRVVLGVDSEVDHINGDGLDNRRCNLRVVTHAQNIYNARGHSSSGYKGVTLCRTTGRWRAKIRVNGTYVHLGRFDDPWDAAQAYNEAAREAWGTYAWLNTKVAS